MLISSRLLVTGETLRHLSRQTQRRTARQGTYHSGMRYRRPVHIGSRLVAIIPTPMMNNTVPTPNGNTAFEPVAGRVAALVVTVWRKPVPLDGAYNATVCSPTPMVNGSSPLTVTEPDSFATAVPMTSGVDAMTSCTVSPGLNPV